MTLWRKEGLNFLTDKTGRRVTMLKYESFKDVSTQYRSAPFWSLNDELEPEELKRQIRLMYEQGIGGFFMHPRGGMRTEYMSKKYLEAIRACVEEAERLGMKAWLYDEDRFASGGAGGLAAKGRPELGQKALVMEKTTADKVEKSDELLGVFTYQAANDTIVDFSHVTEADEAKARELKKDVLVFKSFTFQGTPMWNGERYLDLCNKEAVDSFIEVTHEKYREEFSKYFGGIIPGIFTDEPHFYARSREGNMLPWTRDLAAEFKKMKGYDLVPYLPLLFFNKGNYKKVRFDYWDVMTRLFVRNFSENIYNWCEENKLNFTGHYWEHDFPSPLHNGSTMPNYEFMQYPGIDMLFNTEEEDVQVGNVLIVKEVSSVANQLGKERVLSETYGASGWELNFEDQKKVADWQFALGINLVCQHLVHYSLEGYRKRDFPLSYREHQPWWTTYRLLGDYIGRLSYALSQGKFEGDILVLHPYSSAWPEYSPTEDSRELERINASIKWLTKALCQMQFFYDLGDDIIMERHARVEEDRLIVGRMEYRTVILPHMTLMRKSSFELLKKFAANGGKIIATGATPCLLDGEESEELTEFFKGKDVVRIRQEKSSLRKLLLKYGNLHLNLDDLNGKDLRYLYCHRRRDGDKLIYFLCNIDKKTQYDVILTLDEPHPVEIWDPVTGERSQAEVLDWNGKACLRLQFPPVGSYLLVIDTAKKTGTVKPRPVTDSRADVIELNRWKVERKDYNALVLKRCRIKAGDEDWQGPMDVLEAEGILVQKLGLGWRSQSAKQPWMYTPEQKAVKVPVKAVFTFNAAEKPGGELYAAIERPDLYQLYINGEKAESTGKFYKDPTFVMHDISKWVKAGVNEIALVCDGFNIDTPFEWIYLVGDFKVEGMYEDFVVKNIDEEVRPGDWTRQGYPYYSGVMDYSSSFSLDEEPAGKVVLSLDELMMISARVYVNGKEAGILAWKPYELEIGSLVKKGLNEVRVEVMNSLQNFLGPHNGAIREGIVTPGSFFYGPGDIKFVASGFGGKGTVKVYKGT